MHIRSRLRLASLQKNSWFYSPAVSRGVFGAFQRDHIPLTATSRFKVPPRHWTSTMGDLVLVVDKQVSLRVSTEFHALDA